MATTDYMLSPWGVLAVTFDQYSLVGIDWSHRSRRVTTTSAPLLVEARRQFSAYFDRKLKLFDLPLRLSGTAFQIKVWQALGRIPYGSLVRYGELALQLHTSARAIGNACRANPLLIVIPCHRVVASQGIGGFGGQTQGRLIELKNALIQHEC